MKFCDKNCCNIYKDSKDFFIKTYISKLGPVIIGSKPIHIYSFSSKNDNSMKTVKIINDHFKNCRKIKYEIFKCKDNSTKMIFFNPVVLDVILRKPENMEFLQTLGYPKAYSMDTYLCNLIGKMIRVEEHHEIGVFLGYPLKDVMGFMGFSNLKLTKVNGWRIYGDPTESDEKFIRFKSNEELFRCFVETKGVENALLLA